MNAETDATPVDHLAHLRADAERIAVLLETGPLDAPIAACPGWDVADLAVHLGHVHRWARAAVVTGSQPQRGDERPDDGELATWIRAGADELVETLAAVDADAPTWHPFPVAQRAGVWPRRQAVETALHRWDMESAVGAPAVIDPEFASDAIDEYFEVALPRLAARQQLTLPSGSFHLHCTDTAGEWLVWADDDGLHVRREHAKGDAALRGPAEPMLLRLWGRTSPRNGELDVVGDGAVADRWLALGGM